MSRGGCPAWRSSPAPWPWPPASRLTLQRLRQAKGSLQKGTECTRGQQGKECSILQRSKSQDRTADTSLSCKDDEPCVPSPEGSQEGQPGTGTQGRRSGK